MSRRDSDEGLVPRAPLVAPWGFLTEWGLWLEVLQVEAAVLHAGDRESQQAQPWGPMASAAFEVITSNVRL